MLHVVYAGEGLKKRENYIKNKKVLCVRKNSNTSIVFSETGRLPLKVDRSCLNTMFQECDQELKITSHWVSSIKEKMLY